MVKDGNNPAGYAMVKGLKKTSFSIPLMFQAEGMNILSLLLIILKKGLPPEV